MKRKNGGGITALPIDRKGLLGVLHDVLDASQGVFYFFYAFGFFGNYFNCLKQAGHLIVCHFFYLCNVVDHLYSPPLY